MGVFGFLISVFSRFRTKSLTTKEKLQQIDDELEQLSFKMRRNQEKQKSAALFLLTISMLLYVPSTIIFYIWYIPVLWLDRLLYSIPFFLFPILVLFSRKILHNMFVNRISSNALALKQLKNDKKKILETVMDTETYKVAKELLQKYDPNRSLVEQAESPEKPIVPLRKEDGQELRKRTGGSAGLMQSSPVRKPVMPTNGFSGSTPPSARMPSMALSPGMRTPVSGMRGPPPRRPAPVLCAERSVFDKVADYFIGDGPNNRFALICKQCYFHNGMVLAEEFEFTSYRCCYCGFFNPARKQRLNAPKLSIVKAESTDEKEKDDGQQDEVFTNDVEEKLEESSDESTEKVNDGEDTEELVESSGGDTDNIDVKDIEENKKEEIKKDR